MYQQQMVMTRPADAYKKQSALTATGVDLIIMLYDALKKNMVLGKRNIDKKDVESAHNHLIKAQLIVEELLNCLDMSYPISVELMSLYDYLLERLRAANMKKETEPISEAMIVVDDLRTAWMEVSAKNRGTVQLGDD